MTILHRASRRQTARAALAALGLSACAHDSASPPPSNPMRAGEASRLIVEPAGAISLGVIPPGRPAEGRLTLKNESDRAIVVDRVETTCPCIRLAPMPARVESRSEQALVVRFDPEAEPEFRGGLGVGLTAYGLDGTVLFQGRVDLDVRTVVGGGPLQ